MELVYCGLIFILLLTFGACGSYIAETKNRSQMEGVVFGVLFGPLGLIIVACLPTLTPRFDTPTTYRVDVGPKRDEPLGIFYFGDRP